MNAHTHPDAERLTFGCPGCTERVERERWTHAPLRRVTWSVTVPAEVACNDDGSEICWRFWTTERIPLDVDPAEVEGCVVEIGPALIAAMPKALREDDELIPVICLASEVTAIRVDPPEPPPPCPQPSLFGATS